MNHVRNRPYNSRNQTTNSSENRDFFWPRGLPGLRRSFSATVPQTSKNLIERYRRETFELS